MKFTRDLLSRRNQKGIAILMAVFCVVLIVYIVTEVTYETNIEYAVHARSVQKVKAYYAARSGLELSLLRIKIYQKIQKQYGKQLGSQAGMLNLIWSFPLNWPPVVPESSTAVNKDEVKDKVAESKMDATYVSTIADEGSKIDINDLDSPSKVMRDIAMKQLLQIFEQKMETDQDWAAKHSDFRAQELINNIKDWVDSDTQGANGGDERAGYPNLNIERYPPNRAFRSIDELRLVAGMTDEFFDMLASRVTIYGAKAINPNTASSDVLKALDKSMTDEIIKEVLERRNDPNKGGPFSNAPDFWSFVNQRGGRVDKETQEQTPLVFDAVINFRIQSTGEYGGATRSIEAVVFDLNTAAKTVSEAVKKENPSPTPPGGGAPPPTATPTPTPAPTANQTSSKGPPRIVYWYEK